MSRGRLLLAAAALSAAACAGGEEGAPPDAAASPVSSAPAAAAGPPEGVRLQPGEKIRIRSMHVVSGDLAGLGIPHHRISQMAVEDYGPISGWEVELGEAVDSLCTAEGGAAAAEQVLAGPPAAGVLGTSCSSAAGAAMPLLSEAGWAMVSSGNTSPALTSDLAGSPGADRRPGYYRVSHNDLHQGYAVAEFVNHQLGLGSAAVIHEGDSYSEGMAGAFADVFTRFGGEVTGSALADGDPADVAPLLEELAAASPQALFFPYYPPRGDAFVQQAEGVAGLADTVFVGYGSEAGGEFDLPASRVLYLSLPDQRFEGNRNAATGLTFDQLRADYESRYGEPLTAPFGAHAYDAAVMLLQAVESVMIEQDGVLFIDRAALRAALSAAELDGITGPISCDAYGDCASARIILVDARLSGSGGLMDNIAFSYQP